MAPALKRRPNAAVITGLVLWEVRAYSTSSFVVQANEDFEVLVVNDGSPKNEQAIIDEYVKKYPFIHSIVKENGGYGSVRVKPAHKNHRLSAPEP